MTLPPAFLATPLAHRGYHDKAQGRPENSPAAFRAAITAGYGIELDLQLSADGQAMVFHDYDLSRLTGEKGAFGARSAAELGAITLRHGTDTIPTLTQVLDIVAGQVPLLIEIKDQDGALGPGVGPLESATAAALAGYRGPVAVMSFNPHAVAAMARLAPAVPRGLTTCDYAAADWPTVPAATREILRGIPDYAATGACFISHDRKDLARPRVAALKAQGAAILCWTVRNPADEAQARKVADNITFEGYAA
jgi:glycerophosphoryl diester phosphodiesterase